MVSLPQETGIWTSETWLCSALIYLKVGFIQQKLDLYISHYVNYNSVKILSKKKSCLFKKIFKKNDNLRCLFRKGLCKPEGQ